MPTPQEIEENLNLVRMLVGDTQGSIFYPMMEDEEILSMMKFENWSVMRTAKRIATSIAFLLAHHVTREKSYDIEVWNNSAVAYKAVLDTFLKDSSSLNIPNGLIPYAAGISRSDVESHLANPDAHRSSLARVAHCNAWWTRNDILKQS